VKVDSLRNGVGAIRNLDDPGCVECHQLPAKSQPQTIRLSTPSDVLRIATPIANGETCVRCHSQQNAHLGVLLVDVSVSDIESHLLNDLRVDLLFSAGMTVLITLGIYVLIHRLVVRRVAALQHPLTEFASGKFNARLPVSLAPSDEIDALTDAFNHMAGELERQAREQQAIGELRQRAIMEERERIARELHDGMAQLLGYVNTKAMAVRLMLKNRQMEAADKHLLQLEEAARELFVDVREAILGLKVTGQNGAGLPAALREFTTQFSRLSDIPVELNIASEADGLPLTAEMELQLLRIVQESLTNIRKHAAGTHASVNLQLANGILELTICDDGVGFESGPSRATRWPHVGLSTMRERAEAIGADFRLDSMPGAGTRVTVQLNLEANLACVS
jgi:signal transduction histidine kinase